MQSRQLVEHKTYPISCLTTRRQENETHLWILRYGLVNQVDHGLTTRSPRSVSAELRPDLSRQAHDVWTIRPPRKHWRAGVPWGNTSSIFFVLLAAILAPFQKKNSL